MVNNELRLPGSTRMFWPRAASDESIRAQFRHESFVYQPNWRRRPREKVVLAQPIHELLRRWDGSFCRGTLTVGPGLSDLPLAGLDLVVEQ
jgi:hypothetical protein